MPSIISFGVVFPGMMVNHIYKPLLKNSGLRLGKNVKFEDLFFEPFYQMTWLQLLAAAREKPAPGENAGEMGANIVSVLHASPAANTGLRTTVTSPALKDLGYSIHDVWDQIAPEKRFRHIDSENLIDFATSETTPAGLDKWAEWMRKRYR